MAKRTPPKSALIDAVRGGYASTVQHLLKNGFDPNYADESGWSPLISAATGGLLPIVKILVEAGAKVNAGDRDGFTPLIGAAGGGHTEIVIFLTDSRAVVDQTDEYARTALVWAVTKGDFDGTANALLKLGANPNHMDKSGCTPLMRSVLTKHPRCFSALLEAGAHSSVKHKPSGKTALDMALESECSPLIEIAKKIRTHRSNNS